MEQRTPLSDCPADGAALCAGSGAAEAPGSGTGGGEADTARPLVTAAGRNTGITRKCVHPILGVVSARKADLADVCRSPKVVATWRRCLGRALTSRWTSACMIMHSRAFLQMLSCSFQFS